MYITYVISLYYFIVYVISFMVTIGGRLQYSIHICGGGGGGVGGGEACHFISNREPIQPDLL